MDTLQIGSFTRQVPGTWNELTRKQLLRVLPLVLAQPTPDRDLRLLAALTGFPLLTLSSLDTEVLAQLLPLVDWLSSDEHLLTAQLLPTLLLPGTYTRWHGPRESFRNLLFGEFIFADTFFVLFCQQQQGHFLDQFLATLYRPARRVTTAAGMLEQDASPEDADWNGDVRQAFNEHQLDTRAPKLAKMPLDQKLAVLTWYRGCRAQLAQEFPDVFVEPDPDDPKTQAAPPDWPRVLRKLSGGAFGTVGETSKQPLRLVLAEMQDLATTKPAPTHA